MLIPVSWNPKKYMSHAMIAMNMIIFASQKTDLRTNRNTRSATITMSIVVIIWGMRLQLNNRHYVSFFSAKTSIMSTFFVLTMINLPSTVLNFVNSPCFIVSERIPLNVLFSHHSKCIICVTTSHWDMTVLCRFIIFYKKLITCGLIVSQPGILSNIIWSLYR